MAGCVVSFGGAGGNAYFQQMRKEAMDQFKEKKFVSSRIANKEWRQMQEDLMRQSSAYNRRVNEERLESARNQWKNVMNNGGNNGGGKSAVAGGVNVTTGPVMNMDNKNFITMEDFVAGLQSAAEQAQISLLAHCFAAACGVSSGWLMAVRGVLSYGGFLSPQWWWQSNQVYQNHFQERRRLTVNRQATSRLRCHRLSSQKTESQATSASPLPL